MQKARYCFSQMLGSTVVHALVTMEAGSNHSSVLSALKRALNFLKSSRNRNGLWTDYETLAGESDEWVTAYVAANLSRIPGASHDLAAASMLTLKKRLRFRGGLGFNKFVPRDADSTIWAALLFQNLGAATELKQVCKLIDQYFDPCGGVRTFRNPSGIVKFTRLRGGSFEGWTQPHVCVTAAALGIDGLCDDLTRKWLISNQRSEGCWEGYWWVEREYATGLFLMGIRNPHDEIESLAVNKAEKWGLERLSVLLAKKSDSAFALSYLLLGLLSSYKESHHAFQACKTRLLESQLSDGSWPSSAHLRIPPPYAKTPDEVMSWRSGGKGGGSIILDLKRTFSTAITMHALFTLIEHDHCRSYGK